jgi:hypothetical protein
VNRAFLIKADQRISRLEQIIVALTEDIKRLDKELGLRQPEEPAEEPVKRGPGRPKKVQA